MEEDLQASSIEKEGTRILKVILKNGMRRDEVIF